MTEAFQAIAQQMASVGRRLDARGWVLGTSGNFSAVVSRDPLRMAITPSGASKGDLSADRMLEMDENGRVTALASGKPSAEARLHLEIVRLRRTGAVLHTHSIWSTLLSDRFGVDGGLAIEGFEMLKGLQGIVTHEHREWLPILENSQDMNELAHDVQRVLSANPSCHGFLLRRHGLYTWGETLAEALRHVEILEFLLEAVGRRAN